MEPLISCSPKLIGVDFFLKSSILTFSENDESKEKKKTDEGDDSWSDRRTDDRHLIWTLAEESGSWRDDWIRPWRGARESDFKVSLEVSDQNGAAGWVAAGT